VAALACGDRFTANELVDAVLTAAVAKMPPGDHFELVAEAGAYTRPLFSSNCSVSDTKCTMNTPCYCLTPPKHPLNNP
jgi:hypothetical protein